MVPSSTSGRIYCGRLTRVEWSRGTLQSLPIDYKYIFVANLHKINILVDEPFWVYTVTINCIVFYIFCIKKDDTHEK